MKKYKVIACKVLSKELYTVASKSKNLIDILWLKQALHDTPEKLKKQIEEAISRIENEEETYDAILLGYGICSKGTLGIKAKKTPLVMPRAHDCITMLLGSKERYQELFSKYNGGIYWYSCGWIDNALQPGKERYEKTYQHYFDQFGEDNAKYLMEMEQNWMQEYSCAMYVKWKEFDDGRNEEYIEYTKECADYLDWKYEEVEGSSSLLADLLEGRWDEERFLIVEPSRKIVATNDNQIVGARQDA
ncbi:MAG: DUF1638 domain-containing protein [Eubacteriales bacterium]